MKPRWPVHPFLIGLFPTLFLYAHNAQATSPSELILPALVVWSFTLALWLLAGLALRSAQKAAFLVSLLLVLFFSSNHINAALDSGLTSLSRLWVQQQVEIKPVYVLTAECLLFAAAAYGVIRKLRKQNELTKLLNLFSLVLICLPTANALLAVRKAPAAVAARPAAGPVGTRPISGAPLPRKLPDIYYIILDGYARSDVMRQYFGFDNEPFLKRLEAKGFYVARHSHANYCQTPLCLASSLNHDYLADLPDDSYAVQERLKSLIGGNATASELKQFGYQFVTFSTGFDQTDHPEADVYLSPHTRLTEFQWMLLSTTPLSTVVVRPSGINPYKVARERTLYLLKTLPGVATNPAPTFTFAHIVCPHPPFVFGENGEDVSPYSLLFRLTDGDQFLRFYGDREQYIEGYRKQAVFITGQVERVIDQILERSTEPPIIILQSDHGSGLGLNIYDTEKSDIPERMSILNAYYLPNGGSEKLYQTITPVNSFRVVLNHYFGAKLDLLPDRSFFSTWPTPSRFTDVTDRLPDGPGAAQHGSEPK